MTITGVTSGVKAQVIGVKAGTSTTQPVLYLQYIATGTDNETTTFSNSENITADASVTHTTTYATNVASATTHTSAAQTGVSAKVENGVYYIKGQFVRVAEQTHVISDSDSTATARVGFSITERFLDSGAKVIVWDVDKKAIEEASKKILNPLSSKKSL